MKVSLARPHEIKAPEAFGKVAVLMGGTSSEREVSLMSGKQVLDALHARGVDARPVDPAEGLIENMRGGKFDRAWVALHGHGGEDGIIQGALETMSIPYTGSGVLGCALSMDKLRTKQLLGSLGLATPAYAVLSGEHDFDRAVKTLGLPMIVKPSGEGSSLGMAKVEAAEDLPAAYREAAKFDSCVLAETWVHGEEYTAAILNDAVLPMVRIETPNTFYDYQAKYFSDATRYFCPSGLAEEEEEKFGRDALAAFVAIGAEGWGRVDFMLGQERRALILEVNTVPGMTTHSLVPMAAKAAGLSFDELVWRILETSFRAE